MISRKTKGHVSFCGRKMPIKPIILGCSGLTLTEREKTFFRETNPFGFILFERNCGTSSQIRALTTALRDCTKRSDTPIFIDQEGGRVTRLKPPNWPSLPSMGEIGRAYKKNAGLGVKAMRLHVSATARMLNYVGIDGNCTPLLDVFFKKTSSVMGRRRFSDDPEIVSALGRVAVEAYLQEGVFPVIKHLPGHGRVQADPHREVTAVDASLEELQGLDFKPFMDLKDAPIGMSCHIVFHDIDPANPTTFSRKVNQEIIRDMIGFDGLLMTDDLAMKALSGSLPEIAAKALEAGADILLYCKGQINKSHEICEGLPDISEAALKRWHRALKLRKETQAEELVEVGIWKQTVDSLSC
ncbi:MAG TPA: beta-hexosaminidase [Rhodospirillaceae bacterium]|nr:beta-hexosaminidase [Rhodospirillaceae bacterium]